MDLAASCSLMLDDWQAWTLDQMLAERLDGKWAATESCIIVPRQNGKGSILEALELAGLFLFGIKQILHSAHELKTAKEHYRRMKALIKANPELEAEVQQWRESNEEISIELKSGAKLRFIARSKGGGRGFTGDWNIFDEAYALDDDQLSALMPTMQAVPNRLIVYTSSAGMAASEVLTKLRNRGHAKKGGRYFYAEWSIDYDDMDAIDLDIRDGWFQANPGLGIRLDEDFFETLRDTMSDEGFAREILGVWFDGTVEDVIDPVAWDRISDPEGKIDPNRRPSFAFDVSANRKRSAISQAGFRQGDGIPQVEVRQVGAKTAWVVPEVLSLMKIVNPCAVMIDSKAPTASLIADIASRLYPDLEPDDVTEAMLAEDHRIYLTGADDLAKACGQFIDGANADEGEQTFRHLGDPVLTDAINSATTRDLAGGLAFDRRNLKSDITPAVSAALALYGLTLHGRAVEDQPFNIW